MNVRKIGLLSLALITLAMLAPSAQADVYTGYKSFTEPLGLQSWEVWVTIVGDLDTDINNDDKLNILDVAMVAVALGSTPSDERWDPRVDLDHDGIITIYDLCTVALDFGKKCHVWTVKWQTNGGWPYTEAMYSYGQPHSYIKLWDDKGFNWSWGPSAVPAHDLSGEFTLDYPNTNTWTYTKIRWAYSISPFGYYYVVLKVGVYVAD